MSTNFLGRTRYLFTLVIGLTTGGFFARLCLELTGRPWPRPLVVLLGALSMSVGGLIAWRLSHSNRRENRQYRRSYWPMLLLTLYLIWPHRQPSMAIRLLLLVGLATLLDWNIRTLNPSRWTEFRNLVAPRLANLGLTSWARVTDILTFATFLFLYITTTAPDVLPADSGEFQIVAPLLGVAHPPGYPLYTLLGRLFTGLVPFGTAAYRLNLMSAFLAAGTLTFLGAATRRWARSLGATSGASLVGGLAAALTLGTATTFWAQATMANIRMPTVFAASVGFYALARHADAVDHPQTDRALGLLALALGLGVGHHPSLLFLGCFFLVYLILIDPRLLVQPRRWWRPLLIALLTTLPLMYLPIRGGGDAPLAPPDLSTRSGFIHHITAQGFEGDMFAFANSQDLPQRLTLLPTLFQLQFNPVLLSAAAFGLLLLAWRDRRLLVLLSGGLILHTFVSITYRAPQTVEYLMPAYLPLVTLVGLATAWLLSRFAPRAIKAPPAPSQLADIPVPLHSITHHLLAPVTTLLAAATLLAGFSNGLDHGPSFFILARDRSTRAATESILNPAPPGALILADWRWATPLWYLQWVEGQRPDVEVSYVFPIPGQEYPDTWADRIEAVIGQRPLLLTHTYESITSTVEPLGMGFAVHQRPYTASLNTLSASFTLVAGDAVFSGKEGGVRLLGYRLNRPQPLSGQSIELTLAWQAVGELTNPPSFSAKILNADGRQLTQADRYLGYLGTGYTSGEIRFERLVLPLYPEIPPGDYPLVLEVYSTSQAGFETWPLEKDAARLNLETLSIQSNKSPPITLHPLDAPFSDGPTLIGVDYDYTVPSTLRLYLHWQGPAQGGEQVQVADGRAQLPKLPAGAYHTHVIDLPRQIGGHLRLTLTAADGEIKSAAGPWGWPLREARLPTPAPTARFVMLDDQIALIGVSPSADETVALGDQLFLRLTFLALTPLTDDYGVSVRLLDQAKQWRAKHDLQPALGAIPTLKWIRGSRVSDSHPLLVPSDITGDVVSATLVVYERFRETPLPPLDGRISEIPLGEWRIANR